MQAGLKWRSDVNENWELWEASFVSNVGWEFRGKST